MKKIFWAMGITVFACIAASAEPRTARPQALLAYTDPGSGALLLQYLTMGGLFLAFYFSRARTWLAKHLGLSRAETGNDVADPQSEDTNNAEAPRSRRAG
jgi:hypothetical protein